MDNVFNSFSIHYIKSNVKAWTYNMAAVEANTRYLFETYESSRRICMDWTYYIVAVQQGFSNCASRHLSASWYSPKGISQTGTLIWVTLLYFFYLSLAKRVESVKGVEVQGGWWCMEVGMVGTPILTIHCYSLLILISQWLAEQKNQIQSWFMSYNCSWANLLQTRSCRFTGDTPVSACRSVKKVWESLSYRIFATGVRRTAIHEMSGSILSARHSCQYHQRLSTAFKLPDKFH